MSDAGVSLDEVVEMLGLLPGAWTCRGEQAGIPPKSDVIDLYDQQRNWRGQYDWKRGVVTFYSVGVALVAARDGGRAA